MSLHLHQIVLQPTGLAFYETMDEKPYIILQALVFHSLSKVASTLLHLNLNIYMSGGSTYNQRESNSLENRVCRHQEVRRLGSSREYFLPKDGNRRLSH